MYKCVVFCLILSSSFLTLYAQQGQPKQTVLKNQLRLNFLNPGLDFEYKISELWTVSLNAGLSYGGSFKNLSYNNDNGLQFMISPFADLQGKYFYNLEKRIQKGKNTAFNSANFLSLRFFYRGKSLSENFERTSNLDFSIGPTWGIQRSWGRVHYLFDVGPVYYFDTKGNSGIFPVMIQLNVGYNLLH